MVLQLNQKRGSVKPKEDDGTKDLGELIPLLQQIRSNQPSIEFFILSRCSLQDDNYDQAALDKFEETRLRINSLLKYKRTDKNGAVFITYLPVRGAEIKGRQAGLHHEQIIGRRQSAW